MKTFNVHAAKTHFSQIVADAEAGRETIIARAGMPVAHVVPLGSGAAPRRTLGPFAGKYLIPDDFDAPLPADILDAFEGRG